MKGGVRHRLHVPAADHVGAVRVSALVAAIAAETSIASLRFTNHSDRWIELELEVHAWTSEDGVDVLTPSRDLTPSPARFVLAPNGVDTVRLAIAAHGDAVERAYQMLLRTEKTRTWRGSVAGPRLHSSLPAFVTPAGARASLSASVRARHDGRWLVLSNSGRARMRIASVHDLEGEEIHAPDYVLAGACVALALPASVRHVRVEAVDVDGASIERTALAAFA